MEGEVVEASVGEAVAVILIALVISKAEILRQDKGYILHFSLLLSSLPLRGLRWISVFHYQLLSQKEKQ